MIKKIQQDFSYYSHEFKDNYRKGVHRLRTILASRAQAQAFVSNAGGTAVVLGYEPDTPDKNAQELYALLAASPYIDNAVQTFLGSIYEAGAESQDAMYSDSARCLEILHDPVMSRAAGAGTVSAGKWIATLAGQSCNLYRDMNAVAASDIAMTAVAASETAMEAVISGTIALNAVAASKTAMTAVAANETAMAAVAASRVAMSAIIGNSTALNAVVTSSVAMAAVIGNSTALNAVVSSSTAMAAIASSQTAMAAIASSQTAMAAIASSQTAMAAIIGNSTALNAVVSSSTAMAAVAASYVAVAAVYGSAVAVDAVKANETAWATLTGATSAVMGKAVAVLSGLNPDSYADMTAVASSSTAMAAIIANSTALNAVVSSSAAMSAVAASQTAMAAIASSSTALSAIAASTTALNAIYAKKKRMSGASASLSGKFIILQISNDNAFDTSKYGYATLSDGSKPKWDSYKDKYAYFKQYKKIATYMKNDTDSDDWIDYFQC